MGRGRRVSQGLSAALPPGRSLSRHRANQPGQGGEGMSPPGDAVGLGRHLEVKMLVHPGDLGRGPLEGQKHSLADLGALLLAGEG